MRAADIAFGMAVYAMANFDGVVAMSRAKEQYLHWRPELALASDGPSSPSPWRPLLRTPANPEHPSGAAVSAGLAELLLPRLGIASIVVAQREFTSIEAMSDELAMSRLWGGIHFRRSIEAGRVLGRRVAQGIVHDFLHRPICAPAPPPAMPPTG